MMKKAIEDEDRSDNMKEFDFIRAIQPSNLRQAHVIKGIGDDAAILRTPYQDTILTVDTMVENIHFSHQTVTPFHIGWRALAANISDIAAMGGYPIAYLVSITVSDKWTENELMEIYNGMDLLASNYGMDLIGGDTVVGQELSISITVVGTVDKDRARYRSHARDGDIVFVTGELGGAACGLHVLLHEPLELHDSLQRVIRKHQMPVPNVDFIKSCQSISRMALNDISDGLASEANEIAASSDLALVIDPSKIPVPKELQRFSEHLQYDWKMSGGEDFELVGTIAQKDWSKLQKIASANQLPITKIGTVFHDPDKNGCAWVKKNNQLHRLESSGYRHETNN